MALVCEVSTARYYVVRLPIYPAVYGRAGGRADLHFCAVADRPLRDEPDVLGLHSGIEYPADSGTASTQQHCVLVLTTAPVAWPVSGCNLLHKCGLLAVRGKQGLLIGWICSRL